MHACLCVLLYMCVCATSWGYHTGLVGFGITVLRAWWWRVFDMLFYEYSYWIGLSCVVVVLVFDLLVC